MAITLTSLPPEVVISETPRPTDPEPELWFLELIEGFLKNFYFFILAAG